VKEGIGRRRKGGCIVSTEEEEEEEEDDVSSTVLPSIHLSVSSEALRRVIEYMYCDECLTPLSVPVVFAVLDAATLYISASIP
jgi:transcriptional regulator CtsR